MTDDERKAEMAVAQTLLQQTLVPLLSNDSVVAIRMFYTVNHGDGTFSSGNIGLTSEDHVEQGLKLQRNIIALMMDLQRNLTIGKIDVPKKN